MTESAVFFTSGDLRLEGLLCRLPGGRGAVIAHPHPLYGGDMDNPVVNAIARVYNELGFSTLRFNFRGTGGSQGAFDGGAGERQDVGAALRYLMASGLDDLHLVGYSFGARVLAGLQDLPAEVTAQVHVAPPVALMDYAAVGHIERLRTVIAGDGDDIAPPDRIAPLLSGWNARARLIVVEGADHFFTTGMAGLRLALRRSIVK